MLVQCRHIVLTSVLFLQFFCCQGLGQRTSKPTGLHFKAIQKMYEAVNHKVCSLIRFVRSFQFHRTNICLWSFSYTLAVVRSVQCLFSVSTIWLSAAFLLFGTGVCRRTAGHWFVCCLITISNQSGPGFAHVMANTVYRLSEKNSSLRHGKECSTYTTGI